MGTRRPSFEFSFHSSINQVGFNLGDRTVLFLSLQESAEINMQANVLDGGGKYPPMSNESHACACLITQNLLQSIHRPVAKGHIIFSPGKSHVVATCVPGVDNLSIDGPIVSTGWLAFQETDVEFSKLLHDDHRQAENSGDDVSRFDGSFQWRGIKSCDVLVLEILCCLFR